ncbi:uncharacterized protein N7479_000297 [Penicillium vulpinum]|uniref:Uncharacterized protein n=1 Tax=Penicillium vulpinum TaxID=29845 RepID=A0A1V6RMM5_9EURO|nr:uncharacterized protein N7479_000297 [Penicillium vulpinum]KAJ5970379.1 hypothetical protein N7479_000297 [Penicillium vulpinum]OQE03051.1 hypothetical protein PENVUL_c035G06272 [Penicillium vulpinum]
MSKVALITGAATGIGRGVAEDLGRQGFKVIVIDWNAEEGQKIADQIHGDFYKVDVTSWEQQFAAFEKTFAKYGRIDFVYANAGVSDRVDHCTPESTESFTAGNPPDLHTMNINLVGVVYTSLLALRYFRKNVNVQKPLLLSTSSGVGLYPNAVQPIYSASKHGVVGLARSLGLRFKDEGFRCCAMVPGLVPTNIMPKETVDKVYKNLITSVSQMVAAVNGMLHSDRNGTVCEVSVHNRWYRDPPPFLDDEQRRIIEEVSSPQNIGQDFANSRTQKK